MLSASWTQARDHDMNREHCSPAERCSPICVRGHVGVHIYMRVVVNTNLSRMVPRDWHGCLGCLWLTTTLMSWCLIIPVKYFEYLP